MTFQSASMGTARAKLARYDWRNGSLQPVLCCGRCQSIWHVWQQPLLVRHGRSETSAPSTSGRMANTAQLWASVPGAITKQPHRSDSTDRIFQLKYISAMKSHEISQPCDNCRQDRIETGDQEKHACIVTYRWKSTMSLARTPDGGGTGQSLFIDRFQFQCRKMLETGNMLFSEYFCRCTLF